jgi:hypothetical protein
MGVFAVETHSEHGTEMNAGNMKLEHSFGMKCWFHFVFGIGFFKYNTGPRI